METFNIITDNNIYNVKASIGDNFITIYDVYTNKTLIASIHADISVDTGITWVSDKEIDLDLLHNIGREIESYEA